jgi:hypothetical protein
MGRPKLQLSDPETDALKRSNDRLRRDIAAADSKLFSIHALVLNAQTAHRAGDLQGLGSLLTELEEQSFFQPF